MKKILITGGAGYIGSHVVKQLAECADNRITVLDNFSTGFQSTVNTLQSKYSSIDMTELDLSHWDKVSDFMKKNRFDAVVHFAASLIVPESVRKPLTYYLNNTANTANLIKCCVESETNKFIFSSTAAVYGEPDLTGKAGVTEDMPLNPINPYGRSKCFSEHVIKDTAFAYEDFRFVILRYFNVAGASEDGLIGQSTLNATHLIKVAAETVIGKRKKMSIFGTDYPTKDGTCIRDYIHVDDLASAHLAALDYLQENKQGIFNCGYGHGYSVMEVIDTMKRVSGVDFLVEEAPRREGDPAVLISDSFKMKSMMNWVPKFDDLKYICKTALEWERGLK
ncbi:UDP-glucose 4-epimerase GalE [Sphaerochaeta sp.]|uniref:UDP-glucose 4-epimerase GalE n=1 Tax=Sphaerochaeta sp. TaxID=1972642 RepID=UPI003D111CE2